MPWKILNMAALTSVSVLLATGIAAVAVEEIYSDLTTTKVTSARHANSLMDRCYRTLSGGWSGLAANAIRQMMATNPPVVLLQPTRLTNSCRVEAGSVASGGGTAAIGASLKEVLCHAYHLGPNFPRSHILVSSEISDARYDYIDTVPDGGREALQRALDDDYGIAVRWEFREVEVLELTDSMLAASRLTRHSGYPTAGDSGPETPGQISPPSSDHIFGTNVTASVLADQIGQLLGRVVLDQSTLAGRFDFSLDLPHHATPDEIKDAVLHQLGLQLIPSARNHAIPFLVVEKNP